MPKASSTPSGHGARRTGESAQARIAKALAHPLRACILQRLGERVASPGELAAELGASLGVVSYHVGMLRDYGCVELVRTEPRRGALMHFYRASARPQRDAERWRTLSAGLRRGRAGETIHKLVTDLGAAADGGALEDPELVALAHAARARRARPHETRAAARAHARAGPGDRRRELGARVAHGVFDRARAPALQARPPRLAHEPAV